MDVVLVGEGNSVLKSYPVRMASYTVTATGTETMQDDPSSLYSDKWKYPLEPNHLYSIGLRNEADGIDQPIDLGNTPAEIIMVMGSWQADVNISY